MLVRESLYNFKRESDVITASTLGKKALIEKWLKEHISVRDGSKIIINDDYTIDINGDCSLSLNEDSGIPEYIKFNNVNGYFYSYGNDLVNLNFAPNKVAKTFNISNCGLTSLVGCPVYIGIDFSIIRNDIHDIEGMPEYIGRDLYLGDCLSSYSNKAIRKVCRINGKIIR